MQQHVARRSQLTRLLLLASDRVTTSSFCIARGLRVGTGAVDCCVEMGVMLWLASTAAACVGYVIEIAVKRRCKMRHFNRDCGHFPDMRFEGSVF